MNELPINKIIAGDWIEVAKTLPDKSVHVIITSPPYWGQRNYGVAGQLGLEKTPDEHIAKLVYGFREYRRVLRDDGLLWINYGDKYGGSGGENNNFNTGINKGSRRTANLDSGDLLCLAWRLALAMQADGWILRSDTIWAKAISFCDKYSGSTMPESVNGWRWERHRIKVKGGNRGRENQRTAVNPDRPQQDHNGKDFNPSAQWQDCPGCEKCNSNGGLVLKKGSWRPTRAHEYVLQFAKSNQYYCDMDAVKEKRVFPAGTLAARGGQSRAETTGVNSRPSEYAEYSGKRNLRDVWVINPQPFKGAHYATFPEALVEPMIKVSTSQKGVCPKCGNQWARIVDSKQIKRERPADRTDRHNQENGVNSCGNTVAGVETKTLGWKATCQCGFKETVPAVILDCFAGSGRTCAVAAKLGRNYIGIELNEKYIKDFAVPQTQQAETGVTVEEARAGQRGLFEELSNHEDTKTRKNIEVKK